MSTDSSITLYRIVETYAPDFDFQRWAGYFQNFTVTGRSGKEYQAFAEFTIFELSNQQLIGLKRGIAPLIKPLADKLDRFLKSEAKFFRMSTRSPKDAWIKLAPELGIDEGDTPGTAAHKLQSQFRLCYVQNWRDIVNLVKTSERVQDDMDHHITVATQSHKMSIILIDIRDIDPVREVRLFVKDRRLIAYCPYMPTLWTVSDQNALAVRLDEINEFILKIIERLPRRYTDMVIDIFIDDDTDLHLIELNPFDEMTDPIVFTWNELGVKGPLCATKIPLAPE